MAKEPVTPEDIFKARISIRIAGKYVGATASEVEAVLAMITPDDDFANHDIAGSAHVKMDVTSK
jgi:hypothetical protein